MAAQAPFHHSKSKLGFLQMRQPKETDPVPKDPVGLKLTTGNPIVFTMLPHNIYPVGLLMKSQHVNPQIRIPAASVVITPQNVSIVVIHDYYIKGSKVPIKTIVLGIRSDGNGVVLGGSIDHGETSSKALSRELQEESFGSIYLSESIIAKCPTHIKRSHSVSFVNISGGFSTKAFASNKHKYGAIAPASFKEIHGLVRVPLDNILSGMTSGLITSELKSYVTTTTDGNPVMIDKWAMDSIYRCITHNFHNIAPTIHLKEHTYNGSKHWLRGAIEYKP